MIDSPAVALKRVSAIDGHHKIYSWLCLHALELPSPAGVVVSSWSQQARSTVSQFMHRNGWESLLLRSDQVAESGAYPRGGYVIREPEIFSAIQEFLGLGRTVFLLEPLSPFADLYSLNLAVWPEDPYMTVEIMGPGFDASDLKRGDLSPHETFYIKYPQRKNALEALFHQIVEPKVYSDSVRRRLAKVPRLHHRYAKSESGEDESEAVGRSILEGIGETLLLDHAQSYKPIPGYLLRKAYEQTAGMIGRLQSIGAPGPPLVVSMSYLEEERPIYWDLVWPSIKYSL